MIETTKIMDGVYLKYNELTYPVLQYAVKHYNLDNDDDVVAL